MAPDLYVMNDDGVAEAAVAEVPADMEDLARECAEECPADAIINE
jgi:ferredoxin